MKQNNIPNPYESYNPNQYQPYLDVRQQPQQPYPQGQQGYQQPQQPMQQQYQPMQQPQFTQQPGTQSGGPAIPGMLPVEESYIENILRLNKGKLVTIYATFEGNKEWNAKIFKGIIEAAGRDHVIISDPQTGLRYLIPMVYLDYATFDEEIEYEYPYATGPVNLASYPPR